MSKYINLKSNIFVIAIIIAIFALSLYPQQTYAIPNSVLNYQGRLTNSSGNIVADGTYNITFSIYTDSATSGSSWSETQSVRVKNGIFSAILGNINSINLDFNATSYYLGIKVGSDSEMRPRTQIGAAPFAINSKKLNGMDAGTEANNILQLNASGEIEIDGAIRGNGGLYISSGNIELPQSSILGSYISNNAIDAAKLNISAINSDGKLKALSSDYLADLNGSNLTGINASSIADGIVTNAKVSDTASIAYSKLNLATSIQGSDLASNIAINTSGDLTVSGTFNTTGTFQINSAQLNATATEINNLSGYTGNTNDLNILSGGALAGVTSTEFQYLNGVTSAIQGQLDARLQLAGGTMAGAIAMAGNNITGLNTLSFVNTSSTIADIENQNLLDKSANEYISGEFTFNNYVWIGAGYDLTVPDIKLTGNHITKDGTNYFIQFDTAAESINVLGVPIYPEKGILAGTTNEWLGTGGSLGTSCTWANPGGGALFDTCVISSTLIGDMDLVYITFREQQIGDKYDVSINDAANTITIYSRGTDNETSSFNWFIFQRN